MRTWKKGIHCAKATVFLVANVIQDSILWYLMRFCALSWINVSFSLSHSRISWTWSLCLGLGVCMLLLFFLSLFTCCWFPLMHFMIFSTRCFWRYSKSLQTVDSLLIVFPSIFVRQMHAFLFHSLFDVFKRCMVEQH